MEAVLSYFRVRERGSTLARELRGGLATFLTMAYILFVNAQVLKAAGLPPAAVTAGTALAAGLCCILMGVTSNLPVALASGMGLNAVIAYQVTPLAGSWQKAMGLVVLDGAVILLLVLTGLREAVMAAIPLELRRAVGAGIGLFIAFIGLVNAKLVVAGVAGGPPVTFGSLWDPGAAVALVGLILTASLAARKVTGAMLIGILSTTLIALAVGIAKLPTAWSAPSFSTLFQADVAGALTPKLLPLLFAVMMVDFFDTLGTATALGEQAGLVNAEGRLPGLRSLLVVDSVSASIGGVCGVSSVTAYIESAAGVAEGARTGLHSVVVGLLFLASLFLAPLAGMVPAAATAPALILVGFLMIGQVARIDFSDLPSAIPAFVTLITLPLTYSIAHGIGYGLLTHVAIQLLSGRFRQVNPLMYAVAAAFLAFFLFGAG